MKSIWVKHSVGSRPDTVINTGEIQLIHILLYSLELASAIYQLNNEHLSMDECLFSIK